jgi:hypothetical protein
MQAKRTLPDLQSAVCYALIELAKGIQGGQNLHTTYGI